MGNSTSKFKVDSIIAKSCHTTMKAILGESERKEFTTRCLSFNCESDIKSNQNEKDCDISM